MLKELIDKFYLDGQKSKEQHHFYVTDAGRCPRSIFFKFKNVSREAIEANVLRMFDHGDYIHQMIMKPLLGIRDIHVVASEINIPAQEIISGRADAIISSGKELFVLDIKSMNSIIFKNLTEPKPENLDQIQLYLHYFKIPKGILLYVNKDNQHLKEFVVQYDKKRAYSLIEGLEDLKIKIDKGIVPNRVVGYPRDWQCRYCQFKDICAIAGGENIKWSDFKDRIELREENIRTV
ncbi:MAG: PD-(D/E)XK nuclease family protein [Candidatus Nealsonbacteria bacterium]|nr:PD-(D/E)XK nuclease family protein [Candidatus Nealsonbacteria bacterium]